MLTGSDEPIIVSLGAPQEIMPHHWACSLSMIGAGVETNSTAYGVDGLQALCMAIEMMKTEVRLLMPGELSFDGNPNPLIGLTLETEQRK